MILNLALFVVLPMVIAQVIRLARSVGRWATRHTVPLGITAQIGILCIIYFGSVQTAQRFQAVGGGPVLIELLVVTASVLVIHVAILVAGLVCAEPGMGRPDQIAVAIAGSQKTLCRGPADVHGAGIQHCAGGGLSHHPAAGGHAGRRPAAWHGNGGALPAQPG